MRSKLSITPVFFSVTHTSSRCFLHTGKIQRNLLLRDIVDSTCTKKAFEKFRKQNAVFGA